MSLSLYCLVSLRVYLCILSLAWHFVVSLSESAWLSVFCHKPGILSLSDSAWLSVYFVISLALS